MDVSPTEITDIKLLRPRCYADSRGWFAQSWSRAELAEAGIASAWAQENLVHSAPVGTLRGLHFQAPPHAQGKLITLLRGAIFDVAVDIRRGSPSFGHHVAVRLEGEPLTHIWIPPGFAHGYQTLTPDTEVMYRVTAGYAPKFEQGLRWNDPSLGIAWPDVQTPMMKERDRSWPAFAEFTTPFSYEPP
jgi:dTDP-4-dehydrorhamnose 3,5-epimerase